MASYSCYAASGKDTTNRSAPLSICTRFLAAFLLVVWASPVRAAEPPADIADLFPPSTLAYAELTNLAELAPELASVFKGTALEDSIPFIHGKKDAAKNLIDLNGKKYLAALGLFTSPEMLGEAKKLRIAVGLTGFTDQGDPEFTLVVLTHDSPATGLAARAFLTMTSSLRKVGDVSKVPVFQFRSPNINYDNNGVPTIQQDKPLSDGPHEPTFAYTLGLFTVGSSKNAVGSAVKRFTGEEKGGGLASTAAFKEAAAMHRKTGAFYFINFPDLCSKLDAANKARGVARGVEELVPGVVNSEFDMLAWFKMTANPKAVKSLAGSLRFRDGGLSVTMSATFDPTHKSPLLEFLSGPGVKVEMLHHVRRPVAFAIGITLPEKNRTAALVGFLDGIAKANGELGRLPSEAVREMEQKFKVPLTDGLIGKTRAVTVFLPTRQELPKDAKPMPMLVLHTEDNATATAWEAFFPQMIGDMSGAAMAPQASTETIDGVKVFSLPGNGTAWNAAIHYARSGSAIAVGLDRKLVAQAVIPDAAKSAVGGTAAVSPPADAAAFGVVSLGDVVLGIIDKPPPGGPVVPKEDEPLILPNGNPLPEDFIENMKKARKAFVESLVTLPPATLTAKRVGNELRVELFQPKVQTGGLKTVIDAAASWLDKAGGLMGAGRDGRVQNDIIFGKW
ncbi:MAG: hypothetical protein K8U57_20660 [Planctomycetes bacterium]|nr:hypothetical protein [Planctomycetota bacterium]